MNATIDLDVKNGRTREERKNSEHHLFCHVRILEKEKILFQPSEEDKGKNANHTFLIIHAQKTAFNFH